MNRDLHKQINWHKFWMRCGFPCVQGELAVPDASTEALWFEPATVDALPRIPIVHKQVSYWQNGAVSALC